MAKKVKYYDSVDIDKAEIKSLVLFPLANGTGDQSIGVDKDGKTKVVAGGSSAAGDVSFIPYDTGLGYSLASVNVQDAIQELLDMVAALPQA